MKKSRKKNIFLKKTNKKTQKKIRKTNKKTQKRNINKSKRKNKKKKFVNIGGAPLKLAELNAIKTKIDTDLEQYRTNLDKKSDKKSDKKLNENLNENLDNTIKSIKQTYIKYQSRITQTLDKLIENMQSKLEGNVLEKIEKVLEKIELKTYRSELKKDNITKLLKTIKKNNVVKFPQEYERDEMKKPEKVEASIQATKIPNKYQVIESVNTIQSGIKGIKKLTQATALEMSQQGGGANSKCQCQTGGSPILYETGIPNPQQQGCVFCNSPNVLAHTEGDIAHIYGLLHADDEQIMHNIFSRITTYLKQQANQNIKHIVFYGKLEKISRWNMCDLTNILSISFRECPGNGCQMKPTINKIEQAALQRNSNLMYYDDSPVWSFKDTNKIDIGAYSCSELQLTMLDFSNCTEKINIGDYAFINCPNLQQIIFPEDSYLIPNHPQTLITIGQGAFEECNVLTSVYIHIIPPWYEADTDIVTYWIRYYVNVLFGSLCKNNGQINGFSIQDYITGFCNTYGDVNR